MLTTSVTWTRKESALLRNVFGVLTADMLWLQ
jgi:hypothetical protein